MPTFLYRGILSSGSNVVKEKIQKNHSQEEVGVSMEKSTTGKRGRKIDISSEEKKRIKKLFTISTEFSTIFFKKPPKKQYFFGCTSKDE